jgi:hypothetical protein
MQYKADFGPHELLGADGAWHAAAAHEAGEAVGAPAEICPAPAVEMP